MKNLQYSLITLALFAFTACQPPANEQNTDFAAAEESDLPNYAAFNKKAEVLRSFFKAHGDEDLEAQKAILSDTLQWSPPYYNGNEWLGKEDYVAALQSYHDEYENIKFHEGIVAADTITNGMWSGSVFPEGSATNSANVMRTYGTWTATHTESGKEVGVKWFALSWINDDGQITAITEYFDVHGLAAQIAAD